MDNWKRIYEIKFLYIHMYLIVTYKLEVKYTFQYIFNYLLNIYN